MRALQEDYKTAPISEQDRAMLDYVAQLTRDATGISRQDHERLRAVGFDDRGILQITLIASWFNYINRVADALGDRQVRNKGFGHCQERPAQLLCKVMTIAMARQRGAVSGRVISNKRRPESGCLMGHLALESARTNQSYHSATQ